MKIFAQVRQQQGLSLIELMVALTIGMILIAGVLAVFSGSRQTYHVQAEQSRIQENGRFAMDLIARDIRAAGHRGCSRGATPAMSLLNPPVTFTPALGIQGWEAADTGIGDTVPTHAQALITTAQGNNWSTSGNGVVLEAFNAESGSDIIRVWSANNDLAFVTAVDNTAADPSLTINRRGALQSGDILLGSNCSVAQIFQACSVTAQAGGGAVINMFGAAGACAPGNRAGSTYAFANNGEVSPLESAIYYVGRRNDDAAGRRVLMRRMLRGTAAGPAEEVIEGVINMQLLYGVQRTGEVAPTYVTADALPAGATWENVVAVRFGLVLDSGEAVQTPEFTADVLGTTVTADASTRREHRSFSTTVFLRNRQN